LSPLLNEVSRLVRTLPLGVDTARFMNLFLHCGFVVQEIALVSFLFASG